MKENEVVQRKKGKGPTFGKRKGTAWGLQRTKGSGKAQARAKKERKEKYYVRKNSCF